MEVKINQVVLHLLDPGASEPVLSDRAMDMDADLYEYYAATLERAFASDEVKNCRFLPDSAFAQEMAQNQDFIDLSRRIAGVIFEQMLQYQAIPAGDLAVVDFTADGVPFYGVLKLNYRPGYTSIPSCWATAGSAVWCRSVPCCPAPPRRTRRPSSTAPTARCG